MAGNTYAQSIIFGTVFNDSNEIVRNVKVTNLAGGKTVYNDSLGNYRIEYVQGKSNSLKFENSNYFITIIAVPKLFEDEDYRYDAILKKEQSSKILNPFTVQGQSETKPGLVIIKPSASRPSVTGDIMDIIKMQAGVSSNNELSSQYNVRGGNYDENLIYVNDFEIYRPQLIRSGQQEGLSFINPDMVNNINFSAGGFESRYGDKLSSVLDVSYRSPSKFGSGVQLGLLGMSFYVEGVVKAKQRVGFRDSNRISYLIGGRYRGNKNILNSLDAIGLYKSRFGDLQSLITFHINRYNSIEFLVNYGQNRYRFEPEFQKTTFGTLQSALQLSIGMDGQEIMDYNSMMGGLSFVRRKKDSEYKILFSAVSSNEKEHYDIQGAYQISEVDNNLGSSNFGDVKSLLGSGYFINHARNDLNFTILNAAHQGSIKLLGFRNKKSKGGLNYMYHPLRILYGFKYQAEYINDVFKEWKYNDSADYNITNNGYGDSFINLSESVRSKSSIRNQRISGFTQVNISFGEVNQTALVAGVRYLYSELNGQSLLSPRVQLYYEPNKKFNLKHFKDSVQKKKNLLIKGAFGYYYQAPFYREMRDFAGNINKALKAQRSIHYLGGMEFGFKKFGRPFKFTGEVYYKDLDYLVPYVLDNIRIRYYATNSARGYAGGFDARINGEFIKGLESWFTLSLLKTNEIITYLNNDSILTESKSLRRPTDRRVSASIMFQDELRSNTDYRMHLMLNFGSGLPYYLTGEARYKSGNTIPAYKRVDIGFSKVIIGGQNTKIKSRSIKKLWLGIDVYNLLQINNVISYIWVKDFSNNTYGVPNYLTGRRLNARLIMDF